ncbi:3'-5' exonuclease [Micromonospora pallida]|uniref:3'-5' exonuclease n=1 Tax=Micromonospora pallida TaxID=145854 RepID=UPI000A6FDE3C|nr:3'-5' exonuclease [Micromonospora pallida]
MRLIDKHGTREVIRVCDALVDEDRADVVVSTAHKAKGREWGSVLIADDFPEPRQQEDGTHRIAEDEAMLAYVAVTRAQRQLDRYGLAWIDRYAGPAGAAPVPPAPRWPESAIMPDAPDPIDAGGGEIVDCRRCGCTENSPCPGGCQWATDEEQIAAGLEPMHGDLCMACLPGIVEREQERAAADQKSRCNCFLCNPAIRATWPAPLPAGASRG